MNRLKYLFTYTIVVIIALTSNACQKDVPLMFNKCNSDCFEIRGTLWNASTNKVEADRRINVVEWVMNPIDPSKDYGYVITDKNGVFNIRLNKKDITDTADLAIALYIQEKGGYLNDDHYIRIPPQNWMLNKPNDIVLDVYEEAYISVNINNLNATDTVYASQLDNLFREPAVYFSTTKNIPPGGNHHVILKTAAGLKSRVSLKYRYHGASTYSYVRDSVYASKDKLSEITFDLK